MTHNKNHLLLLGAALALCGLLLVGFAPPASAQSAAPSAVPSPGSHKVIKRHFIVEHMLRQSLQVHSLDDFRDLRTFSYSPRIRDRMEQILNAGGYQHGDRVTIWYGSDTTLALRIKGKPSGVK
jgi:hypothetical protein